MKDRILRAHRLVEWLEMTDGLEGSDHGEVWDWDNNNTE